MTASKYDFFTLEELQCHCNYDCGKNVQDMDAGVMVILSSMRKKLGFALPLTSSIRCGDQNKHARTTGFIGAHTVGRGVDIDTTAMTGTQRYRLVKLALASGATGIGVSKDMIHLDWVLAVIPRPSLWGY